MTTILQKSRSSASGTLNFEIDRRVIELLKLALTNGRLCNSGLVCAQRYYHAKKNTIVFCILSIYSLWSPKKDVAITLPVDVRVRNFLDGVR